MAQLVDHAIARLHDAEAYRWYTIGYWEAVNRAAIAEAEADKRAYSLRKWFSTNIGPTTVNFN